MKKEDLLSPRFEIIADYPDSNFKIGDIIKFDGVIFGMNEPQKFVRNPEKYPHLFKKLQWFERRKKEEMPDCIKSETMVIKPKWKRESWRGEEYWIAEHDPEYNRGFYIGTCFNLTFFTPATEEEYLSFIKKTNL